MLIGIFIRAFFIELKIFEKTSCGWINDRQIMEIDRDDLKHL